MLGSGSDGNSTVFWDSETAFLIDIGFSCKEVSRRLSLAGLDPKDIKGIFVSHEHVDHVRGARVFNKRFGTDIHCTPLSHSGLNQESLGSIDPDILPGEKFRLNGFTLTPFEVPHDANQTVGFVIKQGRRKVTMATDIGHMSSVVRRKFENCDAIILESNHDIQMLKDGPYPPFLKQRILGKKGHLSNLDSASTLARVIDEQTRHVILAHLSRINNRPDIALKEAKRALRGMGLKRLKVVPADQFDIGEIIKIK